LIKVLFKTTATNICVTENSNKSDIGGKHGTWWTWWYYEAGSADAAPHGSSTGRAGKETD
jgi:hypothetical protein